MIDRKIKASTAYGIIGKNVPNWAAEAKLVSSRWIERKMTPEEEEECRRLKDKADREEMTNR